MGLTSRSAVLVHLAVTSEKAAGHYRNANGWAVSAVLGTMYVWQYRLSPLNTHLIGSFSFSSSQVRIDVHRVLNGRIRRMP